MSFVVIVEPEEVNAERIRAILESIDNEFEYELVRTAEAAIEAVENHKTDVFVGAMEMPVMSGTELFSMIEMISPETIRIVMSDANRIAETVAFMNECRTFKIIIKPCRLADDIITPIEAALAYKEKRTELEEETERAVGEYGTDEDYDKLKENWQEYIESYKKTVEVFADMLEGNLSLDDLAESEVMRLKSWYQRILNAYVENVIESTDDLNTRIANLRAEFHDPESSKNFDIRKNFKEEMDMETMGKAAYILWLTGAYCKETLMEYSINGLLESAETAYILRISCKTGNEMYCIPQKEVRERLEKASEIALDAFGFKTVVLNKENEVIINIAIRKTETL
jgi:CheY-like chemotaxis protein